MPGWYPWVVEVVGRLTHHRQPFHHSPGGDIDRRRERHDLVKAEIVEPEAQRSGPSLGCITVPPGLLLEAPTDLNRRCEGHLG